MSLAAIRLAARHDADTATATGNTFGLYRLEILAAFVNALLLFGVAIWVLVEAVRRLFAPAEVLGVPMFVVAVAGLAANLVAFWLLRDGAKESLNVEGASLEVLADTIGSIGVIIAALAAGALRLVVGRPGGRRGDRPLDPAAHLAPGPAGGAHPHPGGARRRRPRGADVRPGRPRRRRRRARPPRLDADVRDGCRVRAPRRLRRRGRHAVLDQARALLADRYHVAHATLQVEPDSHRGCDDVAW